MQDYVPKQGRPGSTRSRSSSREVLPATSASSQGVLSRRTSRPSLVARTSSRASQETDMAAIVRRLSIPRQLSDPQLRRHRLALPPDNVVLANGEVMVFLAGGVSSSIDWRAHLCASLESVPDIPPLVLIRPILAKGGSLETLINWEKHHFAKSSVISFWFIEETLCPMTLAEFGQYAMPYVAGAPNGGFNSDKPYEVVVGSHPKYRKLQEIKAHCKGVHRVHETLDSLKLGIVEAVKLADAKRKADVRTKSYITQRK